MRLAADTIADLLARARRTVTPFPPADGPGQLVWHSWGSGPPLVLLHGGAGSWRHWVHTIPALMDRFTVHAPDLPGLGDSSAPPKPYGPARVASILAAGLRHTLPPATPCRLVGFSFGSIAAGHLVAAAPTLVADLVLVGPAALGLPRAPITLVPVRTETGEARRDANRTNLLRLMIADPARIDPLALEIQDWNATRARVNSVGFAGSTLLLDALRGASCPIAAIYGALDQVAVSDLPGRIAALLSVRPGMSVTVVPGAGHWVMYEAPDAFNAALLALLSR